MEIKKRYQFHVSFFRPGGRLYLRLAYHFRVKMMKLDKSKPYLILCNHTSNADPALVQLAFDRSIHYIAHYELITSRIGKLLNHMFGIIPTKKGKVDLGAIRESMKVAKQNGVIGLFPSGDCTFSGVESYIDDSIVKYVRLLDIDVILFRTHGLYGVDPRFGNKRRKGKATGSVVQIITKEEIKNLSDKELYRTIMDAISINHYERLEGELFQSKRSAEYLERVLFICPDCHNVSTLYSSGKEIECTSCGYKAKYREDLHFDLLNGKNRFDAVLDWIEFEKEELKNNNYDGLIFCDGIKKVRIDTTDGFKNYKKGHLELYKDKVVLKYSDKLQEFDIKKDKMIFHGKKRLVIYHGEKVYNLIGYDRFCGMKYLYYQECVTGK